MGQIIYWGIIRLALTIAGVWSLYYFMDYRYWWAFGILSLYAIVLHPAMIQYKMFEEANKDTIEGTLCSSCKSFDKTAVICTKLDEHPSRNHLPCEGDGWEPVSFEDQYEKEKYE